MKIKASTIFRWIPAILWMGLIFYLSSRSTIGIGHSRTERFLILKSFHLIEYGVLYTLIWWAQKNPLKGLLWAYLYAASDELHQRFVPGREGRVRDTLIDLLGMVIAFGVIFWLRKIRYFDKLWQDIMRI